jgi:glycosyltransferase involved in cell wall biosynthesis
MLNRQLEHVDTFIAKSEFSRNKHREFGFPKDMEVIPYFLPEEPEQAGASERPYDRPYFLFVGRLEKIKGLDGVIPAFASYKEADLLIIGTGEYEDELRRQAEDLPNVIFIGRLPPEDLSRYYKHAIALIVPSVCFETFGIILIESFRKGTPVIARKIGPFTEIIERCNGGALYDTEGEMLDAMKRLQRDPNQRETMARAAQAGFRSYWSEDAVLTAYFKTLRGTALAKGYNNIASALEA